MDEEPSRADGVLAVPQGTKIEKEIEKHCAASECPGGMEDRAVFFYLPVRALSRGFVSFVWVIPLLS